MPQARFGDHGSSRRANQGKRRREMKQAPHWPLACAQASLLIVTMLLFLPWLDLAHAATPLVVNSTLDQADAAVGNGICASAAGVCTLVDTATVGAIANQASASATGVDPDPSNNTGQEATTVTAAPAARFSSANVSIGESAGQATITVNLSVTPDHTVQIDYASGGGTATAGSDYTPEPERP